MRLNGFLRDHPVFTLSELQSRLGERRPQSIMSLIDYHRKRGHIVGVRRGVYLTVPDGTAPGSCAVDPYLLAGKLADDAVLAYHTALSAHGRAYSVRHEFAYLTKHRRGVRLNFRGMSFRAVQHPVGLLRAGKADLGVQSIDRSGLQVRVTRLERTMVDVLDRPEWSGGWEEIWRSLESVEYFKPDAIVEYVSMLGNATTAAKVGFFLEQHKEALMIGDSDLEKLRRLRPKRLHYMERSRRKGARLAEGWNLMVPEEVFARTWDEVR